MHAPIPLGHYRYMTSPDADPFREALETFTARHNLKEQHRQLAATHMRGLLDTTVEAGIAVDLTVKYALSVMAGELARYDMVAEPEERRLLDRTLLINLTAAGPYMDTYRNIFTAYRGTPPLTPDEMSLVAEAVLSIERSDEQKAPIRAEIRALVSAIDEAGFEMTERTSVFLQHLAHRRVGFDRLSKDEKDRTRTEIIETQHLYIDKAGLHPALKQVVRTLFS